VLGYVLRFDPGGAVTGIIGPGGAISITDKEYRPLTLWRAVGSGRYEWRWASWPPPRPLYGLHELAQKPDAPVIIAEGEKTCNALRLLLPQYVAVTSPNGSKSPGKADWSPLQGRTVVVWPDADVPGQDYAHEAAKRALRAGAVSVAIISPPDGVKPGWDAADALADGWDETRAAALIGEARSFSGLDELRAPDYSDEALALRFADRYADDLRYVAFWSSWVVWDRYRWVLDDTLAALDKARVICRDAAAATEKGLAKALASVRTVAAVERLARTDRRLATTAKQWDGDGDVFVGNSMTVELLTGMTRPARREDYCMKSGAISPADPGTPCPMWSAFL
jgi:putative DNA primase/helicase